MKINKRLIIKNLSAKGIMAISKNLRGQIGQYNKDGGRSMNIYLDDATATYKYGDQSTGMMDEFDVSDPDDLARFLNTLEKDGWNFSWTKENQEKGYASRPKLTVKTKLVDDGGKRNPIVKMLNSDGTAVPIPDAALAGFMKKFDSSYVESLSLAISPFNYEADKQSAWFNSMYVRFGVLDPLAGEFAAEGDLNDPLAEETLPFA